MTSRLEQFIDQGQFTESEKLRIGCFMDDVIKVLGRHKNVEQMLFATPDSHANKMLAFGLAAILEQVQEGL